MQHYNLLTDRARMRGQQARAHRSRGVGQQDRRIYGRARERYRWVGGGGERRGAERMAEKKDGAKWRAMKQPWPWSVKSFSRRPALFCMENHR
jgi:hypothetical protein